MIDFMRFKRALATMIFLCFFLPLSKCSEKESTDPHARRKTAIEIYFSENFIPVAQISFKAMEGLSMVFVFAWPGLALGLDRVLKTQAQRLALNCLEITLSIASLYWLWEVFRYTTVRYAGYMAILGYAAWLAIASVTAARIAVARRLRARAGRGAV